jgi:hypothetical protein
MLALLHSSRRLTGGQNFQQPTLLAQRFLDFGQPLQCLEDSRQVRASAAPAFLLSFRIRRTPWLGHFVRVRSVLPSLY